MNHSLKSRVSTDHFFSLSATGNGDHLEKSASSLREGLKRLCSLVSLLAGTLWGSFSIDFQFAKAEVSSSFESGKSYSNLHFSYTHYFKSATSSSLGPDGYSPSGQQPQNLSVNDDEEEGVSSANDASSSQKLSKPSPSQENSEIYPRSSPGPVTLDYVGVGYDRYILQTTDSFTGDPVEQLTATWTGWLGLKHPWDLSSHLSFGVSGTPTEKLTSSFGALEIDKNFSSGTLFGIEVGAKQTSQSIQLSRRRISTVTENRIGQRFLGGVLAQKIGSYYRISSRGRVYSYDRSLDDFFVYLNANYQRQLATVGLADAVASFPKSDLSLGHSLSFESWSVYYRTKWTTLALDNSLSVSHLVSTSFELGRTLELTLGYRWDIFDGNTNGASLLSLGLVF